jgi:AcrR family transcriptional regulator
MPLPARIIRRQCDDLPGQRPFLSLKEEERCTRILDAGQMIMAIYGRAGIRMTEFALGLRMSPLTVRRYFPDLDHLLGEILRRHLQVIIRTIGTVPRDAPNRQQARRAAYLAATRTGLGAPTEAHLLLIRDRHLLPPDEAEPIECLRATIGDILAGEQAQVALALLDTPELNAAEIEAALAAVVRPRQAATPQPEPPRPRHEAPPLATIKLAKPRPAARPTPRPAPRPAPLPDTNAARRPRAGPH